MQILLLFQASSYSRMGISQKSKMSRNKMKLKKCFYYLRLSNTLKSLMRFLPLKRRNKVGLTKINMISQRQKLLLALQSEISHLSVLTPIYIFQEMKKMVLMTITKLTTKKKSIQQLLQYQELKMATRLKDSQIFHTLLHKSIQKAIQLRIQAISVTSPILGILVTVRILCLSSSPTRKSSKQTLFQKSHSSFQIHQGLL